ncbi:hypothetical protein GCM10009605_26050 [Nocardiopsis composta]
MGMTTARTDQDAHGDLPEKQGGPEAPEDGAPAQPTLRDVLPWKGKATTTDKALLGSILGIFALMMVLLPLRPYLIASNPVLLEFLTGSKAAIGSAAAFARIGEIPLWLAVFAGTVGMAKFDWLFWWTGRQWGRGIVDLFASGDRAKRFAARAQELNPWILRFGVLAAVLPGVPSALVYALAGWTGMRLVTFLVLDVVGALAMTGLVAGLGYGLGQHAVDVVLLVDKYALWVSLAIIIGIAVLSSVRESRRAARKAAAGEAGDARRSTDEGAEQDAEQDAEQETDRGTGRR